MKWRYQIVKRDLLRPLYNLAEVFIDADGNIEQWSEDAVRPVSETREGVIEVLEMMLKDAKALPVFDEAKWEDKK